MGNCTIGLGQSPTQEEITTSVDRADLELQAAASQRASVEVQEGIEEVSVIRKNIWIPVTITSVGLLALWGWTKRKEQRY